MADSEIDLDSLAIRALGSLFKLTEVFLWDDGYSNDDPQISSFGKHIRFKYDGEDDADYDAAHIISSNSSLETMESTITEDSKLTQQMSALGLPLSFQTNKQMSGQTKVKSKGTRNQPNQSRLGDQVQGSPKMNEESLFHTDSEVKSSNSSSLSILHQTELSCSGSEGGDDLIRLTKYRGDKLDIRVVGLSCGRPAELGAEPSCNALEQHIIGRITGNLMSKTCDGDLEPSSPMEAEMASAATTSNLCAETSCSGSCILGDNVEQNEKQTNSDQVDAESSELGDIVMQTEDVVSGYIIEPTHVANISRESSDMLLLTHDGDVDDCMGGSGATGDWSVYWDFFYMRYYFYNDKTKESTWCPPPGMEYFASGGYSDGSNESKAELPEVNVDPGVSGCEEKQVDRCKLVYGIGSGEQNGEGLGCELTTDDLSSASNTPSDNTCTVNAKDLLVLGGNNMGEILLDTSFDNIEHYHSLEKEEETVNSVDIIYGAFPINDLDTTNVPEIFDVQYEVNRKKFDDNITVKLSNASSLMNAAEVACDDEDINQMHLEERDIKVTDFDMLYLPVSTKRKKKRRNRARKKCSNDNGDHDFQLFKESGIDLTKYWNQRYLLFSRFDDGIEMDAEGWFSVTPEAIARHQASRSGGGIVIDCFTGAGGNAIQFAKVSKQVIAIDIDPKKIEYACHNAAIYGVEDKIDFITGDSFSLAPKLNADTIFLSPPWGGPDYAKLDTYDISMLQPYDGCCLFNTFKAIASKIIMFLPKNVNVVQLAELSSSANPPWSLEVEKNFLNGKLKAVTAYFSKNSQ